MKKSILFFVLMIALTQVKAQINNPIQWSFTAKKIADKTYELQMTATIGNKWHLYAQDAGEGPEPTSFKFIPNPLVTLDGKVKEIGKMEKSFDKNFNSTLKFYSHTVTFTQKVKLKTAAATLIKGTVTYMTCDDHQCLPPRDVPISIKVGGK
jgi:thiol:disulfide interchange protein DsbD